MAYVPGYDWDAFISYAHVDNEPDPGIELGWVSTLKILLDKRLKQRTEHRDECKVWFDKALAGNAALDESIITSLEKTAILLVILSRGYLKSDWCKKERAAFRKIVQHRTDAQRRVFAVELDKIEIENRPDEFRNCKGYQFWSVDEEGNRDRRLGVPQPKPDEGEYWSRVDDLGYELAAELDRLRDDAETVQPASTSQAAKPAAQPERDRGTVFVAEVTEDLIGERDEVSRSLSKYRVLPRDNPTPYPLDVKQYEAAYKEDLKECALFVQLLSDRAGKNMFWPEGFARAQYDWAVEVGVEILQWRKCELDVDTVVDENHRSLLRKSTVRAVGLEEFKRTLESKLQVADKVPLAAATLPAWLHINSDDPDAPLSDALCDSLDQRQPPVGYDLDETDDLEYVRKCWDGIIFVYGQGDVDQIGRRIRKWYKLANQIERDPPLSLALYLGPPAEKARMRVKPPDLVSIDGRAGLNDSALSNFIAGICQSKAKQLSQQVPAGNVATSTS